MIPTIAPGVIAGFPVGGGDSLPTTHVLHVADDGDGSYGYNGYLATSIWGSTFGSVTGLTVPSGSLGSFEIEALATDEVDYFYIIIEGVQTRDFFTRVFIEGMFDGVVSSADSSAYFIQTNDGLTCTFWRWDGLGNGNFASLGDRDVGFEYNPIYQTDATTKSFNFGTNSSYAWNDWPDLIVGDVDNYDAFFSQGGKMDVYAAYASIMYPTDGTIGDPCIFGKHNGIAIGYVNGPGDNWLLLYLQNSDGTENYELSGTFYGTPLRTVDAVYHETPDSVSWGTKTFAWNITLLGWGGPGFDQFTIENLD